MKSLCKACKYPVCPVCGYAMATQRESTNKGVKVRYVCAACGAQTEQAPVEKTGAEIEASFARK